MLYLTDDSQHIQHVSLLPLYMGKSSNVGSWPQVSGHNGREVHCCVKPCLVRSYISFPKQGPTGPGLELREYSAAVKELKWIIRNIIFQTSPSPDELNEMVLAKQLCD